jgi:hypothetical protein
MLQERLPTKLGLQELCLYDHERPSEAVELPDIRTLILDSPTGSVLNLVERFSSISTLVLHSTFGMEDSQIMAILKSVGRNLHTLVLMYVRKVQSLTGVLQSCPKLKRLRIFNCVHFEDEASTVWPANLFSSMEEVYLEQYLPPECIMQVKSHKSKIRLLYLLRSLYCKKTARNFSPMILSHNLSTSLRQNHQKNLGVTGINLKI